MEVWILEWSYHYDSENNITVWSNKRDAQKQALDEISELFSNDWDMDDENAASCAEDVEDMISRGHYDEAIRRFHDYQDDYNSDYAQYWHVYSRDILTGDSAKDIPTIPAPAYKASCSGATCRGPCGNFNEYAYADRADGTYVCRQCSTFHSIFGTKSP